MLELICLVNRLIQATGLSFVYAFQHTAKMYILILFLILHLWGVFWDFSQFGWFGWFSSLSYLSMEVGSSLSSNFLNTFNEKIHRCMSEHVYEHTWSKMVLTDVSVHFQSYNYAWFNLTNGKCFSEFWPMLTTIFLTGKEAKKLLFLHPI